MKKGLIAVVVLVALGLLCLSKYNSLVNKEEAVTSAWSQVENVYQRRADLIPNLVNTVKGYAAHEKSTLEAVVSARSRATQITVDPQNLTEEQLLKYQQTQGELASALGKLLAITENYPELKANENFMELQHQLEGTENRIAVERKNFNEVAQDYNTTIRRFPTNIVASVCGFERKAYFQAQEGAEKAPEVSFE